MDARPHAHSSLSSQGRLETG